MTQLADPGLPWFDADGAMVGAADFARGLTELGVVDGDVLFAHSDLSTFGKLAIDSRQDLMEGFCAVILNAIGPRGTLVMPTFTYSFCKGEVFDVERTKSTVGALTEYFRTRDDVVRTQQPIFAASIWGHEKASYLDIGHDAFDEASIFGKLHQRKGKILFIGVPFQLACTYVHYIEQSCGVPYRYMKTFTGTGRTGAGESLQSCTYFVRRLDQNVTTNLSRFEAQLLQTGVLRQASVGVGHLWLADAAKLYQAGCNALATDIRAFLE